MKKMWLAVVLSLTLTPVISQEYYQAVGFQSNLRFHNAPNDFDLGSSWGLFYKGTYALDRPVYPRVAFSAYPSIGIGFSFDGPKLDLQLPVAAEVYIGDIDDLNFFAGLGFCAGLVPKLYDDTTIDPYGSSLDGPVIGPQISVGTQFDTYFYLVGIRTAFTYGLNRDKTTDEFGMVSQVRRSMLTIGAFFSF